jgi:hypothetical protein
VNPPSDEHAARTSLDALPREALDAAALLAAPVLDAIIMGCCRRHPGDME